VVKLVEAAVVFHQGQHHLIVVRPLAVLDPALEKQALKQDSSPVAGPAHPHGVPVMREYCDQ
jgi:hypothetical protein